MHSYRSEGIVIKRRNSGEADKFVTVFTRYHGKLQVKASGVRKITSKRSAHIELLNHVEMHLHTGKNYPILTEVQSLHDYAAIKSDLERVGLAYHVCELIDGLCPEGEEHRDIFTLLESTLQQLCTSEDSQRVIHGFEVALLTRLGYWQGQPEMSQRLDTQTFIENIIEKKLKSRRIFTKM